MLNLPQQVTVVEVGPRDGFQMVRDAIPTPTKIEVVDQLARTGLRYIQAASFVHPRAVPQMADAEAVMAGIPRRPGVIYEVLVPNRRGVERALAAGANKVKLMLSVTDAHSQANANCSAAEAMQALAPALQLALERGLSVSGGMSVALGCPYEGFPPAERLLAIADFYHAAGVREISVADTAGLANPALVYDRISRLRDRFPDLHFSLHLHDTRRMAAANVLAGLQAGITEFDSSIAGLGGCPYCPGATGNIATEDLVYMLHAMGIATGVDLDALVAVARYVAVHVPHPVDSALLRTGPVAATKPFGPA